MSNQMKCKSCGSTDIDVDPSRADAVCTNCGNVLESSIIVSDIQFEENAHGGASAIGTFVPGDAKGKTKIVILIFLSFYDICKNICQKLQTSKELTCFKREIFIFIFSANQVAVCLTLEEVEEA